MDEENSPKATKRKNGEGHCLKEKHEIAKKWPPDFLGNQSWSWFWIHWSLLHIGISWIYYWSLLTTNWQHVRWDRRTERHERCAPEAGNRRVMLPNSTSNFQQKSLATGHQWLSRVPKSLTSRSQRNRKMRSKDAWEMTRLAETLKKGWHCAWHL